MGHHRHAHTDTQHLRSVRRFFIGSIDIADSDELFSSSDPNLMSDLYDICEWRRAGTEWKSPPLPVDPFTTISRKLSSAHVSFKKNNLTQQYTFVATNAPLTALPEGSVQVKNADADGWRLIGISKSHQQGIVAGLIRSGWLVATDIDMKRRLINR